MFCLILQVSYSDKFINPQIPIKFPFGLKRWNSGEQKKIENVGKSGKMEKTRILENRSRTLLLLELSCP